MRYPSFRLVKAGSQVPLSSYATDIPWRPTPLTGAADPGRVAQEFAEGATVVLQALHHTWNALASFCRELEACLGHATQANAYYTPARSQGFGVHHDTHDVLVLQVGGAKRWLVYEPVLELPLKAQRYAAALGETGPATHDLTLHAGDTLYLPRGWLHEALTSESDSLHLTIGINVYTWLEALRAAVETLADDVELRRAVAAHGEGAPDLEARLAERLKPQAVAARKRARLVESRRPVLEGQLEEIRSLPGITLHTTLERRSTVIADLDGRALVFEGKRIDFPAEVEAELAAIVGSEGPFSPASLPGSLDESGRLVLVRRLIREGFLRRAHR